MLETSANVKPFTPSSMPERRKLIEVGLPLDAINRAAKKEKTTTNGHPSTFHLWWGHRPYSVVRALLFATLVDDPSSRPDLYNTTDEQDRVRNELFQLISALVEWKNVGNPVLHSQARAWIEKLSDSSTETTIVDPFCGRGTIPLEAQRLGCRVFGSDLNPVAVLVSKALVEIPARFANATGVSPQLTALQRGATGAAALAADIEEYGDDVLREVRAEIGACYPAVKLSDGSEAQLVAWLWARTVKCPNPICGGAETPLLKSNVLSAKPGRSAFLKPIIALDRKHVEFSVSSDSAASFSNVTPKKGAKCVFCGEPISLAYIREATARGELGTKLLGGVADSKGKKRFLGSRDMEGTVPEIQVPDHLLDVDLSRNSRHMGPTVYGLARHRDLYTKRQLTALSTFSETVAKMRTRIEEDALKAGFPQKGASLEEGGNGASAYADAVATYLAIAVSRLADRCSTLAFWQADESVGHVFVRPALPMTWDFVEPNPLADSAGSFINCVKSVARTVAKLPASADALIQQADSRELRYPENSVIVTDPPYYDNIPYADVSEYFYVWLRESLKSTWPTLLGSLSTPKVNELTFDRSRHHGSAKLAQEFVSQAFEETFARWRKTANTEFPSLVFYAYRATEKVLNSRSENAVVSQGWEAILTSLVRARYQITGTWPIGTERGNRFRSIDSNALGSSIVLVCRPLPEDAARCTRADLLTKLRIELPSSVRRLREANLAATDLEQAAIGPGMAIFSRYSEVLEADGSAMTVGSALALINNELTAILRGEIGDVDAETQFALTWFDVHFYDEARYAEAESQMKLKNADLTILRDSGVVRASSGVVQLLRPSDLDWSELLHLGKQARQLPMWAQLMFVIASLVSEDGSVDAAADIFGALGTDDSETLRAIAYHCYLACDRAKRSIQAQDFNALITAWPDIQRLVGERTAAPTMARLL